MDLFKIIEDKINSGAILYIDFDDTLVDFCNSWLVNVRHKKLKELTFLPNKKEEIDSFRFFKVDSSGLTEKSLSFLEVYDNIEYMPGALDFINKLKNKEIQFKILTTTHSLLIEPIKNKILKDMFNISSNNVIHTKCKQEIIKGNILIDDAIHNIKNYEVDEETLTIMIEQPWNIRYKTKYKIKSLKALL